MFDQARPAIINLPGCHKMMFKFILISGEMQQTIPFPHLQRVAKCVFVDNIKALYTNCVVCVCVCVCVCMGGGGVYSWGPYYDILKYIFSHFGRS